jgi:hypothetical protein
LPQLNRTNVLGLGEKLSPFGLSAEHDRQQHRKIIAPMRAVIPQDISVRKFLYLARRVLVAANFNISHIIAPPFGLECVRLNATPWVLETKHSELNPQKLKACFRSIRSIAASGCRHHKIRRAHKSYIFLSPLAR